jgi:peptide/nickel transport system permease protein
MYRFVAERFTALVATLVAVSVIIFLSVRFLPGSILDLFFAGDNTATPEQLEAAKKQLGLTGSYFEQYWRWASGAVHGDFGHSLLTQQPVSKMMADALPIDIELIVLGILIALLIGIPLGVLSAIRRDRTLDYVSRVTGLAGISLPNFWLATLLLIFTSRVFGWVPPLAYVPFFSDPWQNIQEFFLPAIAISVFTLAIVMRMVRATMLEVLGLDYVRTARAKGAPRRTVITRHALRNALIPVVTVAGFEVGVLISGAAVAEIIFGLPGVGYQLLHAIFQRDYPVVQASVLIIAATFIIVNFFVDILYGLLDPRISVT